MLMTLLCWAIAYAIPAESARILCFFPVSEMSHHFVYRPVMEELAKRGHDIFYVTGYPYEDVPGGISQIDISEDQADVGHEHLSFIKLGQLDIPSYLKIMYSNAVTGAQKALGAKEVQELIHSDQRFDAVIIESYNANEYLSAFIHKFNAIGIELMNYGDCAWTNELAGLPDNPAYQLDYKAAITSDMDFWERLYNTYVTFVNTLARYYYMKQMQFIMDRYFNYSGWQSRPAIDVLARNRSLILVNFDVLFGYPYPVPPHRKDIGGINIRPNKPLPQDLQKFMDEGNEGVIYMSLGSQSSEVANEVDLFMSVFKKLRQKVLLKFETENPIELPENVRLSKWFPQQDILAHNNCVLFITHGGLFSLTEVTYYGVPLLGVPFFVEQEKNMMFVEAEGFGRMLRPKNLSTDTISWTIREIVSNKRYKEEIVRRSKIFKDKRHSPAEEAAYWIEHSLKYPYFLTPKSVKLTAIQLHLIDIKTFIAAVLITVIIALFIIIHSIMHLSSKPRRQSKQKLY